MDSTDSSLQKTPKLTFLSSRKLWFAIVLLVIVIWFVPWVFLLSSESIVVEREMPGKGALEYRVGPGVDGWVPIKRLPKHVYGAFVAAEDTKFFQHYGFDFESIFDNITYNWKRGRFARGGSTITQQLIKNTFLSHEKSMVRKLREATGALLAELLYDKMQLLEWYLNVIEVGPGLYGIEQGAWHYFRKPSSSLTVEQAAQIALVLPNPKTWNVSLKDRVMSDFAMERFAAIVTNMRLGAFISLDAWHHAMLTGDFGGPIHSWPKAFDEAVTKLTAKAEEEYLREIEASQALGPVGPEDIN